MLCERRRFIPAHQMGSIFGLVHHPILQCGIWSSPNARSQLSPRYFQPKTQAEMLNRNIWRTTRIQMELLTFEVGAASSLLRI